MDSNRAAEIGTMHLTGLLIDFLKSKGFTVSDTDPCVYTLQTPPNEQIIVIFWVDDLILASSDITLIEATKQDLSTCFKMDD